MYAVLLIVHYHRLVIGMQLHYPDLIVRHVFFTYYTAEALLYCMELEASLLLLGCTSAGVYTILYGA